VNTLPYKGGQLREWFRQLLFCKGDNKENSFINIPLTNGGGGRDRFASQLYKKRAVKK